MVAVYWRIAVHVLVCELWDKSGLEKKKVF